MGAPLVNRYANGVAVVVVGLLLLAFVSGFFHTQCCITGVDFEHMLSSCDIGIKVCVGLLDTIIT